jgi:XTP/dITP diphosphohydrolase|tara:strand:- start:3044 stop:3643 length:600 start_codon:yes stop_codon:yes gene_type:complete
MYNKKIKKLILGTNNQGKVREIKNLLSKHVILDTSKNLNIRNPKETGSSFLENSLIKAKYFSRKTKAVCLADDSGLEIDILGKLPGIYSARWAGKKSNFKSAIKKVYKELDKKEVNWKKKVKCRFICALTIYWPDKKFYQSQGIVEGIISKKSKGSNGFGYDPIFIPKGYKKTFGEMLFSKKFKIDHRYKAFKKIKKFF